MMIGRPSILITAILSIILLLSVGLTGIPSSAQGVTHSISEGYVDVSVGNINIRITSTTGIEVIEVSGKPLVVDVGWEIRDPSDNLIGETYKTGGLEVVMSPSVSEFESGITVVTHSRIPPDIIPHVEVKTTYTIYNTGLIIINTTLRAYSDTEAGHTRFVLSLPLDVFLAKKISFVYDTTPTEITPPDKYKTYTLYEGPLVIMHSSTDYGDIVIMANEPTEISVRLDDMRKYGSNYLTLKFEGVAISGALQSGQGISISIIIYPHTKGSEYTNHIVNVYNYIKSISEGISSLSKRKTRTPGGAKLLRQCLDEYSLARNLFMQGDVNNAYTHALKAFELIKKAESTEVKQRILFFIVIPDIIFLLIVIYAIWSARAKVLKQS